MSGGKRGEQRRQKSTGRGVVSFRGPRIVLNFNVHANYPLRLWNRGFQAEPQQVEHLHKIVNFEMRG